MSLGLLKKIDKQKFIKDAEIEQIENNYINFERWSIQNESKPIIYKNDYDCINCLYYNSKAYKTKCIDKKKYNECMKNDKCNYTEIKK